MAKFLTTTSLNYFLEELVKKTTKNLILISPYLKINDRLKELLQVKADGSIKIRIVYGKQELAEAEFDWLMSQKHIEVYFCKNLHAKCYMNDANAIISSLNLYAFSQINNNEMGVLLTRSADSDAFGDAYAEVIRILKISNLVSINEAEQDGVEEKVDAELEDGNAKLTTSRLAKKHNVTTSAAFSHLCALGYLELREKKYYLTDQGKSVGAEFRMGSYGFYFLWPESLCWA
jgi:phosphatidylserine/phosphatidylglycerophosphate/cardiolipin synthase-like enzyme